MVLFFFNIGGVDDHHHLHLLFELEEHPQFAVRLKTRKNTGGVVIIVQLPAKLQIQLAAKLRDALADVFRLCVKIFSLSNPIFCITSTPRFQKFMFT